MIKKSLGFSIAFLACFLAAGGAAFALPSGIAGIVNTGTALASLQLDQNWTGTAAGTLSGSGVDWWTGYDFTMTYGTSTAYEKWSFCVSDTEGPLSPAPNYTIYSLNYLQGNSSFTYTQYDEAAYLISEAMAGAVNPVAAQAAIWTIIFPGYTYGSDTPYGDNPTYISTLAGDAETAINSGAFKNGSDLNNFYLVQSPTNQDYIFSDPVPEPSTLLLLGSGLVGLVGWRWRRAIVPGVL